MQNLYLLFGLILSLLPLSAEAQSSIRHRLTAGLVSSTLHLETQHDVELIWSGARNTSSGTSNAPSEGIGLSLGYQGLVHPRWELAARANYLGNKVPGEVDVYGVSNLLSPERLDELRHPREYRALWFEGMVFWRVPDTYSLVDIQIGTGISYAYFQHSYLRGYILDMDRELFDVKQFFEERKTTWGIPIHMQLQYALSPKIKIGFNGHVNPYFDGTSITGVMAFGAYCW